MKFLIVSLALVAAVAANAPYLVHKDSTAAILRSESDVHPEGFSSVYETSNGISAQAQGSLKALPEGPALVSQGSFQYTDDNGNPFQLTYIADENGFQPQGAHLPTPPPTPEHVLRTLQLINAHPTNFQRYQ